MTGCFDYYINFVKNTALVNDSGTKIFHLLNRFVRGVVNSAPLKKCWVAMVNIRCVEEDVT